MVEGSRKRFTFPDETLEPAQTAGIGILAGSDTNQTLKGPLKVIRADSYFFRKLVQRPTVLHTVLDEATDALHHFQVTILYGSLSGPTATTRPESRAFCCLRNRKEEYLVSTWPAGRTGWAAVYPRGPDCEYKRSVTACNLWSTRLPKGLLHRQRLVRGFVSSRLDPRGGVALDNHQRNVVRRPSRRRELRQSSTDSVPQLRRGSKPYCAGERRSDFPRQTPVPNR